MDNSFKNFVKIFLSIYMGIILISIISILLLCFSFEILVLSVIGVDFAITILLFFVPIYIYLPIFVVIIGIIALIICFKNKKINYLIIIKNFKYFIPLIFYIIYSIYLFLMYDLQSITKIEIILNCIGIVIWLIILFSCNIPKKYFILFSLLAPINCILVKAIVYQNMFGIIK